MYDTTPALHMSDLVLAVLQFITWSMISVIIVIVSVIVMIIVIVIVSVIVSVFDSVIVIVILTSGDMNSMVPWSLLISTTPLSPSS